MSTLYLESAGLIAPGLNGWAEAAPVLAGERPYERRRATASVRLAFRAAEDALRDGRRSAADLATVFASADGDLEVVHRINHALAQDSRTVSPTDFHNSVHNAAGGYWSIAVGSRLPSASVAAHDASFAAGLLEAAALVAGDGFDTLLVVYDIAAPALLRPKRPVTQPCGVALVLAAQPAAHALAKLELKQAHSPQTPLADPQLSALCRDNPAAAALPLLVALARRAYGRVALPAVGGTLDVALSPP
jgi:hypothetical protein